MKSKEVSHCQYYNYTYCHHRLYQYYNYHNNISYYSRIRKIDSDDKIENISTVTPIVLIGQKKNMRVSIEFLVSVE